MYRAPASIQERWKLKSQISLADMHCFFKLWNTDVLENTGNPWKTSFTSESPNFRFARLDHAEPETGHETEKWHRKMTQENETHRTRLYKTFAPPFALSRRTCARSSMKSQPKCWFSNSLKFFFFSWSLRSSLITMYLYLQGLNFLLII